MLFGEKNSDNLLLLFAFSVLIIIEWNEFSYLAKFLNMKVFGLFGNSSLIIYLNQVWYIGIFSRYNIRHDYWLDAGWFIVSLTMFAILSKLCIIGFKEILCYKDRGKNV